MANLPIPSTPAEATFSDQVYRLETTDPVLGHDDGNQGVSNQQAIRLIENDIYLKKHVDDIESGTGLGDNTISRNKLVRGSLPAGMPRNTVVNGPYDAEGNRALLTASGNILSNGAFRAVFAAGYDAKGPVDYFGSVGVQQVQNVSSNGYYYLYADMNQSTFAIIVRGTTIAPIYSHVAPSSPVNNQRWYDMAEETMKVWNSGTSTWDVVWNVFVGEARKLSGDWQGIISYEYRRDTNLESGSTPAGTIVPFAGGSVPTGWLLCDGKEHNISSYPRLYAAIGTSFGGDTEQAVFQVPDLRGRVPVGLDNMGGLSAGRIAAPWGSVLAGNAGSDTVTLTINQIPAHGHPYRSGTANVSSADGNEGFVRDINMVTNYSAHNAAPSGTDGQQIGAAGGGQSHTNIQPSVAVYYIIKA